MQFLIIFLVLLAAFAFVRYITSCKEQLASKTSSTQLQPLTTLLLDQRTSDTDRDREKAQKFALFVDFISNMKHLKEYKFANILTSTNESPMQSDVVLTRVKGTTARARTTTTLAFPVTVAIVNANERSDQEVDLDTLNLNKQLFEYISNVKTPANLYVLKSDDDIAQYIE